MFNKTSSVYQTPVERQWFDTNLVTRKWKEGACLERSYAKTDTTLTCFFLSPRALLFRWLSEFRLLEAAGFLVSDARHPDHAGDLFSLIAVYRAAIVRDVDAHYEAVCVMKKKKDTRWAALHVLQTRK